MQTSSNKSSQNNEPKKPQIVMAFGTFDYFHAGHENYLKQAKALGDTLIAVIARDSTTTKVKSQKPSFPEKKRLRDVAACKHVDKAVLGNQDDKYKIIKKIRPNVIALGYDQFAFTYGLEKFFIQEKMNSKIIRLLPFEPQTFKSSLIKKSAQTAAQTTATTTTPCDQEKTPVSAD